jgi:oxalate decarboxylase
MPPSTDHGSVDNFWFPFSASNKRVQDGGWSREVTKRELPIAKSLSGVNMRLTAGGVREMHWHLPAEWAFMLYGNARITGFDQDNRSFVADVSAGDLWNFPSGILHSIQGLGPDGCEFLLVFDDGAFSEFSTFLPTTCAYAGRGPGEELRRVRRRIQADPIARALHLPGARARRLEG